MKRKKGYLIPDVILPADEVCFQVPVPNDIAYIRAFRGQLFDLSRWGMWDKTAQKNGILAAERWRDSYERIAPCGGTVNIIEEDCYTLTPTSYLIEYAPNDPYQTPDVTPPGYNLPPWRLLNGRPHCDLLSFPTNILELPALFLNSGFPRFKVRFSGQGKVQLYLREVPQGGLALITLDGNPLSGEFVDMSSLGVFEFDSLIAILEVITGGEIVGGLLAQRIIEVNVNSPGDHYIDVTCFPQISTDVLLGMGMELEDIKVCTDEPIPVEGSMAQFQVVGCDLQWRPNPQAVWQTLGSVCGEDGASGPPGSPGAPGQPGEDGVCLDCGETYEPPTDPANFCRAAIVAARFWVDEITANLDNLVTDLPVGIAFQDGLPRSVAGDGFTPAWESTPQWVKDYWVDEIMTDPDKVVYVTEHLTAVLYREWSNDSTFAQFLIRGSDEYGQNDYPERLVSGAEMLDVYQYPLYLGLNHLVGVLRDLVAICFYTDDPQQVQAAAYEANLQSTFPENVNSCPLYLVPQTIPSSTPLWFCLAAEEVSQGMTREICEYAKGLVDGAGGWVWRRLDPDQLPASPMFYDWSQVNATIRNWLFDDIYASETHRPLTEQALQDRLYAFWFGDPDLSNFIDRGQTDTGTQPYEGRLIDAKAYFDLGQWANMYSALGDAFLSLTAIGYYQHETPSKLATWQIANLTPLTTPPDCGDPTFSHEWDLIASDGGWLPYMVPFPDPDVPEGQYSIGVGWIHTNQQHLASNGWCRSVQIMRPAFPSTFITAIECDYIMTTGTHPQRYFFKQNFEQLFALSDSPPGGTQTFSSAINQYVTGMGVRVAASISQGSQGALSGSVVVTRIKIDGIGFDPF